MTSSRIATLLSLLALALLIVLGYRMNCERERIVSEITKPQPAVVAEIKLDNCYGTPKAQAYKGGSKVQRANNFGDSASKDGNAGKAEALTYQTGVSVNPTVSNTYITQTAITNNTTQQGPTVVKKSWLGLIGVVPIWHHTYEEKRSTCDTIEMGCN